MFCFVLQRTPTNENNGGTFVKYFKVALYVQTVIAISLFVTIGYCGHVNHNKLFEDEDWEKSSMLYVLARRVL